MELMALQLETGEIMDKKIYYNSISNMKGQPCFNMQTR